MQYLARQTPALLALTIMLAPTLASGQTPPAGTLDASFGVGGLVTTDFLGGASAARVVAVQPHGKILAAVLAFINGLSKYALARYNPDGWLDPSFGAGGIVATDYDFPGNFDAAIAVALQPDG